MIDWLEQATLPTDWQETTIGQAYTFTRRPRDLKLAGYPSVPFVPMDFVPAQGASRIRWLDKVPDELTSSNYFERGDVLLSRITPSFENGKQGLADNLPLPFGFGSTELIPIQAKPNESDARFLFYLLLHPVLRFEIANRMEGSTGRQRVPESVVREWPIPLPPLDEQRKIAAVLGKVQAAVEMEGELIRVTRELKHAALRQLFTRGLRGEPQKQTDLGPVPESWDVVPLSSVASFASGGTPSKNEPDNWGSIIPWVSPKDMKRPRLSDTIDHITEKGLAAGSRLVPAGSILVVIRGMILLRDVPVALTMVPMAFNQDMKAIMPGERLGAEFLLYAFEAFRPKLFSRVGTSAHGTRTLASSALENLSIPLPDPTEQRAIAGHLAAIDAKLAHHEARQKLLRELFRALLHDLMTARRRVTNLDLPTP
jgi:type I restriction enzyme S subunit